MSDEEQAGQTEDELFDIELTEPSEECPDSEIESAEDESDREPDRVVGTPSADELEGYEADEGADSGEAGEPVSPGVEEPLEEPEIRTRTVFQSEYITDFSAESIEAYEQSGAKAFAVYDDDTEVEVSWLDVTDPAGGGELFISESEALAEATGQHFWDDDSGIHVTDDERDAWGKEYEKGEHGTLAEPTTSKPWHNILVNSLGVLLRAGLRNLVSITRSAVAFYDGLGNGDSNVTAFFGRERAQIGKSDAQHAIIDSSGLAVYNGDGTLASVNSVDVRAVKTASDAAALLLDGMRTAAESAGTTLDGIYADAESAKGSAESALSSAAAAEAGLGRVIDVVGVLDWVEGHARLTSDTSAVDGKDYYSRDAATGTMSTADPSGMYAPTDDGAVDPSKTYYERAGTEEGPDAYTVVAEPADEEIGSYYERGNPALLGLYELDESVQQYVMSYLALVDGVLKLSSGGTARMELSADALRFVAPDGNVAASVEVGEDGRSVMRITRSVAVEDVQFGDWKFYQRANGNMAIKWVG